jgi:hypothetical protein
VSTGVDSNLVEQQRSKLMAAAEPEGAVGIQELRSQLLGTEETEEENATDAVTTEPVEVVVLGRIGGTGSEESPLANDFPWDKGRAAFVMMDPSFAAQAAADDQDGAESHASEASDEADVTEHLEHDHHAHAGDDHHDCPFCKQAQQAAAAQAIVQFVGDDGEPLPIDARQLFDLQGDELVVVKGKARLTVGMLMVQGEQIYIRR